MDDDRSDTFSGTETDDDRSDISSGSEADDDISDASSGTEAEDGSSDALNDTDADDDRSDALSGTEAEDERSDALNGTEADDDHPDASSGTGPLDRYRDAFNGTEKTFRAALAKRRPYDLMCFCEYAIYTHHHSYFAILLDLDDFHDLSGHGVSKYNITSLMFFAADVACAVAMEMLLTRFPNVNSFRSLGRGVSPLHQAARSITPSADALRALLLFGAVASSASNRAEEEETVEFFFEEADGILSEHNYVRWDYSHPCYCYMTSGDTPLHLVAKVWGLPIQVRKERARLLIEAGADVNARNKGGNTPLHCDAYRLSLKSPWEKHVENESLASFLREFGADRSIRNHARKTCDDVLRGLLADQAHREPDKVVYRRNSEFDNWGESDTDFSEDGAYWEDASSDDDDEPGLSILGVPRPARRRRTYGDMYIGNYSSPDSDDIALGMVDYRWYSDGDEEEEMYGMPPYDVDYDGDDMYDSS